jgi:Na+/melibiose symporter-like transporter
LQSKLTKARIYSFDLLAHLEARTKQHEKSREHTTQLTQNISGINNRINALNTASPPDILSRELAAIEEDIEPLKKQSPYTLLMMRVVEIGLPLLLSLLALFFAVRYSLTEKRTFEIKDLLRQRNRDNNNGTGQTGEVPSV